MTFIRKTSLEPKEGYVYSPLSGLYHESDEAFRKRIKEILSGN